MTTTAEATQALERVRATPKEKNIRDLIKRQEPEIVRAIGDAIGAERFARIVETELRRTPKLYDCEPHSVIGAMMLAAQLDLEPGPLGHSYLVPYANECTFVIGYTGYLQLAWRSEMFKDVTVRTVYEGDLFRYREGLRPVFEYEDCAPDARGAVVCYAGLFRFRNGGSYQNRLWPAQIEAAKARSAAGRKNQGPWHTDYDAMARKTVVRAARPWLPMSGVMARAFQVDSEAVTWNGEDVQAAEIIGEDAEAAREKED